MLFSGLAACGGFRFLSLGNVKHYCRLFATTAAHEVYFGDTRGASVMSLCRPAERRIPMSDFSSLILESCSSMLELF